MTYDTTNGGLDAAFAALDAIIAAGGEGSVRRLDDHNPDAWILEAS